MSNTTVTSIYQCATHALWWDWFRVFLGLMGFSANGMIVLPIVRYQALRHRKEYVIIAGLAFSDCLRGLGKVNANLRRMILFALGLECSRSTITFCMMTVHAVMKFSQASAVIMLLVVSCDRLYAVSKPVHYFKSNYRYAVKFVLLGYALSALNLLAGTIDIFDEKDKIVSSLCIGSTMFSKLYLASNKTMESIVSASSVIIYLFVPLMYRREVTKRVTDKGDQRMDRFRRNQKKMMITLGFSSVCTLFLDSIPRLLGYYFKSYIPKYELSGVKFGQALSQLTHVNGILNFIFCVTRHSELRYAMKAAIHFKSLPVDTKNWTGCNTHIPPKRGK